MELKLHCKCGADVPFEEHDRGFEVYCPSCAQACMVPAEDAAEGSNERQSEPVDDSGSSQPSSSASAKKSVFSGASAATVQQRVAKEVACLCGETFPVRVEDIGYSVYCPKCGAEVDVGRTLGSSFGPGKTTGDSGVTIPVPKTRFRLLRSPLGVFVTFLILAGGGYGSVSLWSSSNKVISFVPPPPTPPPAVEANGEEIPFEPENVTLEFIDELLEKEDPFEGLMTAFGWQEGLQQHGIEESDPRFARLTDVAAKILVDNAKEMLKSITGISRAEDPQAAMGQVQAWGATLRAFQVEEDDKRIVQVGVEIIALIERLDPITLTMIEALLKERDLSEALIQAHMWQDELTGRRVSEADKRVVRLAEVVVEIRQKLIPGPPQPSPHIDTFRKIVKSLSEALHEEDVTTASRHQAAAQGLLDEHTDILAPYTRRYYLLKNKLQQLKLRDNGVVEIEKILHKADEIIAAGRVGESTEALQHKSKAKLLATVTPMLPAKAEELEQRLRKLSPELRHLRGKRCLDDARKCQNASDPFATIQAFRQGMALLAGLSENKIADEIKQLNKLRPSEAKLKKLKKPASTIGREILLRRLYEDVVVKVGNGDMAQLLSASLAAHEEFSPEERKSQADYGRIIGLFQFSVEMKLATLNNESLYPTAADKANALLEIRRALNGAEPWQETNKWKQLDGAVGQLEDGNAQDSIQRAIELAKTDDLVGAVATITPATELGLPASREKARFYLEQWQKEIKIRADKQAAQQQWRRIQELRSDAKTIEVWYELDEYVERYPLGAAITEAKTLLAEVEDEIHAKFAATVIYIRGLVKENKWAAASWNMNVLKKVARTAADRSSIAGLAATIDSAKEDSIHELRLLGPRRNMAVAADVMHVARVAAAVLALDPDNEEAQQLMAKARKNGERYAKVYVKQARTFKSFDQARAKRFLRDAYELNPDGEFGRQASALWKEWGFST